MTPKYVMIGRHIGGERGIERGGTEKTCEFPSLKRHSNDKVFQATEASCALREVARARSCLHLGARERQQRHDNVLILLHLIAHDFSSRVIK